MLVSWTTVEFEVIYPEETEINLIKFRLTDCLFPGFICDQLNF